MTKNQVRLKAFKFLGDFNPKIRTKLNNISGKTGKYNVPDELFQKRTSRKNRVLISWKKVKENRLTIDQLETFSGGVAVEFINEDLFDPENQTNPTFIALKNKIGSDDIVSSIISIRSESGSSSSQIQRHYFNKLMDNTIITYKGNNIVLNRSNYMNFAIKQIYSGGTGNEKWSGFLFISIKGGQQDTIESHNNNQTIFNPACEFANEDICLDLDLVLSYFALLSVNTSSLEPTKLSEYNELMSEMRQILSESYYDSDSYTGNLLDYCNNHPCAKMSPGELYDPIQVEKINITDFAIDNKEDLRNLDLAHNEAVVFEKYYWDKSKNCILTAARPTNVFWSRHLSNMMQQNFTLDGYFRREEEIVERRKSLLNN